MSRAELALSIGEREPLQDHCGIIAIYATGDIEGFDVALEGLEKLQTRGYDGAGVWTRSSQGDFASHKGEGLVHEVFTSEVKRAWSTVQGKEWILQVRYGTNGDLLSENVQPMSAKHRSDDVFAVVHNGEFTRFEGDGPSHISDTAVFVRQLAEAEGDNWDERIITTLAKKEGAWSLAISTPEGMYFTRGPEGVRPLVYGVRVDEQTGHTAWVAASETSALEAMGVHEFIEVMPGEIVKITDAGPAIIQTQETLIKPEVCSFETVYLAEGDAKALLPRENRLAINVAPTNEDLRRESGRILAIEAPVSGEEVDFVIGVPGTGIPSGQGFAEELGLPYLQAIKDRTDIEDQRTFMMGNVSKILERVLNHFEFDVDALRGKRVALVDDSQVRGNIMTGLIQLLKEYYGVLDVHVRIASPMIIHACVRGVNTRDDSKLIAKQKEEKIEEIQKAIGARSLAYLQEDKMKEAYTGDPHAEGFCTDCMAKVRGQIADAQSLRSHRIVQEVEVYQAAK